MQVPQRPTGSPDASPNVQPPVGNKTNPVKSPPGTKKSGVTRLRDKLASRVDINTRNKIIKHVPKGKLRVAAKQILLTKKEKESKAQKKKEKFETRIAKAQVEAGKYMEMDKEASKFDPAKFGEQRTHDFIESMEGKVRRGDELGPQEKANLTKMTDEEKDPEIKKQLDNILLSQREGYLEGATSDRSSLSAVRENAQRELGIAEPTIHPSAQEAAQAKPKVKEYDDLGAVSEEFADDVVEETEITGTEGIGEDKGLPEGQDIVSSETGRLAGLTNDATSQVFQPAPKPDPLKAQEQYKRQLPPIPGKTRETKAEPTPADKTGETPEAKKSSLKKTKKKGGIKKFLKKISGQKEIKFKDEVKVDIPLAHKKSTDKTKHMEASETLTVPTDFSDRASSKREIKQKGYSSRARGKMSVKGQVKEAFPDLESSGLSTGVTFIDLKGRTDIDFDQITNAAQNKITSAAFDRKIFPSVAKEGSKFIADELNDLLQGLPSEDIKTVDDLKEALKKRITNNNKKKEMIDKETFADLADVEKGKIPGSVYNAPQFKVLQTASEEGSWGEDEEKEITFTEVKEDQLPKFMDSVDDLFKDPLAVSALQQFIS